MRYREIITEAKPPENIDEALWWIQRYVTGSLTDEDWDYGEPTHLTIDTAMALVSQYIGNSRSTGIPLSRYLLVDKNTAKRIVQSRVLPPNQFTFQSFSAASPEQTLEIGREINFYGVQPDMVEIVVTTTPSPSQVLFGFSDVKASSRKVGELYEIWSQDWEHQAEVLVRVTGGLPLAEVRVVKNKKSGSKLKLKSDIDEAVAPDTNPFRIEYEDTYTDQEGRSGRFDAYVGNDYAGSMSIGPARSGNGYSVMNVYVNPQFRRMKLATRFYNAAYKAGYKPIVPDSKLAPDGRAFWDAHVSTRIKLGKPLPKYEWKPVKL